MYLQDSSIHLENFVDMKLFPHFVNLSQCSMNRDMVLESSSGHSFLLADMASSYHSAFWFSKIDFVQQACVHLSSQGSIVCLQHLGTQFVNAMKKFQYFVNFEAI